MKAAGADPHYQQAITAAGTGSMAALDAEAYLETLEQTKETALKVSP